MKYDAIVEQGISIHERVPIPEELIPEDSRVEIDAKIHAGYCKHIDLNEVMRRVTLTNASVTTGRVMSMAELSEVQGRAWDDVDVSERTTASITLRLLTLLFLTALNPPTVSLNSV